VNIWKDEWIPNSSNRKVFTRRGSNLVSMVCELINPVTNQWDEELIDQTFDACRIKVLPLPSFEMSDFVAWNLTKNEIFSVKSAYYAEWESQFGQRVNHAQASRMSNPHPMWETI
jgi:hypothetical protein